MQPLRKVIFLSPHSHAAIVCVRPWGLAGAMAVSLAIACASVSAQTPATAASGAAPVAVKLENKPLWKDLTPAQQTALKPLAAQWNNTSESQKRKWLALSLNYAKMSPPEQAVLHERMLDWSALSATQRSQARLNFSETKRLAPGEKQAKWEAYQTLDPEEKEKLAKSVRMKLPGAATALKLVPAQKLAEVPPGRKNEPKGPSIAAAPHQINPKTLLPLEPQHLSVNVNAPPATGIAKPLTQ